MIWIHAKKGGRQNASAWRHQKARNLGRPGAKWTFSTVRCNATSNLLSRRRRSRSVEWVPSRNVGRRSGFLKCAYSDVERDMVGRLGDLFGSSGESVAENLRRGRIKALQGARGLPSSTMRFHELMARQAK